jgi:biotin transporter BioY
VITTSLAMVLGNLAIYTCGVIWLASFVGMEKAISLGLTPFLAGDVIKLVIAAALLPSGWKLIRAMSR